MAKKKRLKIALIGYGAIARDALGIFPEGPEKHALLDVVDFCIERAY